MSERTRLPLPKPGFLGLIQYAGVDMHAYSDAENAALREQVRVLREALEELTGAADDDSADRWEAAVRAALEATK